MDRSSTLAAQSPVRDISRARVALGTALLAGALLGADLAAPVGLSPLGAVRVHAATPSKPTACVAGWRQMPVPDRALRATPFELVERDGRPGWLLGGSNAGSVVLRWDGHAWRPMGATPRGFAGLTGGDTISGPDLRLVGYRRTSSGEDVEKLRPIGGVLRRATWRDSRVPPAAGTSATLVDVEQVGGRHAWAVGTRIQGGRTRAYLLHWNGRRWRREEPASGRGSGLQAVESAGPGGPLWAVGWREAAPGVLRPSILRRGRARWHAVAPPALPSGQAVLTDVRFRGRADGWAVGYLVARGGDRHAVILLRWDGRSWAREQLPWAEEGSAIPHALSIAADGDLWIAGTEMATKSRETRGFIAHRSGGAWQVSRLDTAATVRSQVTTVTATHWGAAAAGVVDGSMVILHACDDGAVTPQRSRRVRVRISDRQIQRGAAGVDDASEMGSASMEGEMASREAAADVRRTLPTVVTPRSFRVRDMARRTGLAQWTQTYGGFAADFDGDGRPDVFIGRHGQRPRLAMNRPHRFRDARVSAFSRADRHGCDAGDVDHDGSLDVLCALGAMRGKATKRHELTLAPQTDEAELDMSVDGIVDPLGRGRRVVLFRLDADPYPEAFITNSPDREDGLPSFNRFYRNRDGRFVPALGMGLDAPHGGQCAEATDIERDGDDDLAYCTRDGFAGRRAGLRILRNEGGRLHDRTAALGVHPIGDVDVAFADVTGDGRRDLIQVSPDLLRVSRRTASGYRRVYQVRLARGTAVAAGDVSGDGVADLYVVQGGKAPNRPDRLLVSRSHGRRFQSVRIPQTTRGSGDDVIALDYDGNGLTDFVVLNGRLRAGPVQLLAAVRRS